MCPCCCRFSDLKDYFEIAKKRGIGHASIRIFNQKNRGSYEVIGPEGKVYYRRDTWEQIELLLDLLNEKEEKIIRMIEEFGGIDGEEHKQWLLDQIILIIKGKNYAKWIAQYIIKQHRPWNIGQESITEINKRRTKDEQSITMEMG